MDIQYLNGIDIQLLNGTSEYEGPLNARQRVALNTLKRRGKQHSEARRQAIAAQTMGLNNRTAQKAMALANGTDFAGFSGDGSEEDAEIMRTYLEHTKEVVDAMPTAVISYGNPKQVSQMLGYVLDRWDTPEREQALDDMIVAEERQVSVGGINTNVAEDAKEDTQEDYYDVDSYVSGVKKRSFLRAVKKGLKPSLTTECQDLVAANPATVKAKGATRERMRARRQYGASSAVGLLGVSDDVQALMDGTDLEYLTNGEDPVMSIARYVQRTMKVAKEQPYMFANAQEARETAIACDMLLKVWNNTAVRDRVFDQLANSPVSGGLGKLFSKLKKAVKKAASTVAKGVTTAAKTVAKGTTVAAKTVAKGTTVAAKTVGKGVATAAKAVASTAKKVGKAIAKVAKKVWKLVVRYNPLTLLIRAGILAFCRLNMYKIANKCYAGSITKEGALKIGVSEEEWEKSNKAYKHLANAYTKLGGSERKLKQVLAHGKTKTWTGTEYPTDASAIKAVKVSEADDKEAQADSDYDQALAEMKAKGYIADSTVSAEVPYVSKQEEVTIIDNERTTTKATNLNEDDSTTSKVLVTVPKAEKVLVDLNQTSGNYIAATYGDKNGWILRNDLAGLGACDAEAVAITGLGGIYDQYGCNGLGAVATGTAIASAAGTIASIMAKIKDIFGTAKNVVETAKTATSAAKSVVTAVKNKDVSAVISNVKNTANAVNNVKNAVTNKTTASASAATVTQKIANAVSPVQNIVNTIKDATKETTKTVEEEVKKTEDPTPTPVVDVNKVVDETTKIVDDTTKVVEDITAKVDEAVEEKINDSKVAENTNNSKVVKYIAIGGIALAAVVGLYFMTRKK